MSIVKYQTEIINEKMIFSFLQENDFIKPLELDPTLSSSDLQSSIKINSQKSGVDLNIAVVFQMPKLISGEILKKSKENPSLCFKNNKFTSFFYSLIEFPEFPNVQILYTWNFRSNLVSMSRTEWCGLNELEIRNCCFRNYLIDFGDNFDLEIKKMEDLDKFCKFPKKFLYTDCLHNSYLLNAKNKKVRQDFKKLDLYIPYIRRDNHFSYFSHCNTPFLSSSPFKTEEKLKSFPTLKKILNPSEQLNFSPKITPLLKELNHYSLVNQNCQDLLVHLSLENQTFENYLSNCLITLYRNQLLINKNHDKTKMEIKLLLCEFLF